MNIVLTSGFIYGKTEKLCRKEVKYSSSIYVTFNVCTWY